MGARHHESGQALPWLLLVVAAALLATLAVAADGLVSIDRARAQAAADAVALAGALDGRVTADEIADANGATILDYHVSGSEVAVEVRVRRGTASAAAIRELIVIRAP